jgi:endonuclease/exonuclease/phosphatase (EEP) superfamily protein YafD
MYLPKFTPLAQTHHSLTPGSPLPDCFTLLAWNLQKVDFSHHVHRSIDSLLPVNQVHLLSLQEAATQPMQNTFFNLPFVMAPNIQTRNKHFGVLTASEFGLTPHHQCLTQSRELGWMTHKTALITEHPLSNGLQLTHVNIHAINFVPHALFKKELLHLWQHLAQRHGPMIISGDFNTWTTNRMNTLRTAAESLGLKQVTYPDSRPINLLDAHTFDVPEFSDHNPLTATFCLTPNHTEHA